MENPKNMKELLEYAIHQRAKRTLEHHVKLIENPGNECSPLTDKEWKKVITPQKKSFSKARKPAYNKIWRHNDVKPI